MYVQQIILFALMYVRKISINYGIIAVVRSSSKTTGIISDNKFKILYKHASFW